MPPRVRNFVMPDSATQAHGPRHQHAAPAGGVDVRTLFLTACASAGAAYACSKVWAPGTLASAAFTPVLVAIIKEALAKPTAVVARAVPIRGVVRSAPPPGPASLDEGWTTRAYSDAGAEQRVSPLAREDPATRVAQQGEIESHAPMRRRRGWRLAIITGLLGFLVCAVVFTVPELVAGRSAGDGARGTTIFGGGGKQREGSTSTVQTQTTTTPTRTVTLPPATTVTVPAPATTVTTPTAPTTTAPPPATTVPAPANPDEPATGVPPAAQPAG